MPSQGDSFQIPFKFLLTYLNLSFVLYFKEDSSLELLSLRTFSSSLEAVLFAWSLERLTSHKRRVALCLGSLQVAIRPPAAGLRSLK